MVVWVRVSSSFCFLFLSFFSLSLSLYFAHLLSLLACFFLTFFSFLFMSGRNVLTVLFSYVPMSPSSLHCVSLLYQLVCLIVNTAPVSSCRRSAKLHTLLPHSCRFNAFEPNIRTAFFTQCHRWYANGPRRVWRYARSLQSRVYGRTRSTTTRFS